MKPWVMLDSCEVPGETGKMELFQRDDELVIRVDGHTLMSTRMHSSEDALADLSFDVHSGAQRRILIGGLGMGFTAAAALRRSVESDQVVVAELVPSIVDWNRGILGDAAGRPLDDPRLEVHVGDVTDLMKEQAGEWDIILLDVDNGPSGLSTETNDRLYGRSGLNSAHRALCPGGVFAVWSANRDTQFTARMKRSGFQVDVREVRAHGRRGSRHIVWIGRKR